MDHDKATPQHHARELRETQQHARAAMDAMPAAVDGDAQESAPPTAVDTAARPPAPPALMPGVTFSVYSYGFRFLKEELDVLTDIFAQNGGATPSHAELHRIAAAMSATPARLAEPPHPVREKQIKVRCLTCASAPTITLTQKGASLKTWFENRRQKLRRQRDRAEGRIAPSKRSRSSEEYDDDAQDDDDGIDSDHEDARVMAAAKALLEASAAVPAQRAEQQEQPVPAQQAQEATLAVLTPVRGVPIANGATPTAVAALAAPAEAASPVDGGIGALLHAIRDEVDRSTLSAHTKELLMLHLLHSWSVLRMLSDAGATQQLGWACALSR
jgi:hypothetical protein